MSIDTEPDKTASLSGAVVSREGEKPICVGEGRSKEEAIDKLLIEERF